LFGWASNDLPMGPDSFYTMFQLGGRDVGACCTLQPDQQKQGVPPHWMTYIAVTSADDAAAKAASLGGKVIAPAFDVFDVGRMAVIQDPTGAMFCVWQAKAHCGVGVFGEPNSFCWSELLTRDLDMARNFYTALFGWEAYVTTNPAGFQYTHWRTGGVDFGGMMALKPEWGPVPPHWMNYVSVADCDGTVAKATSLGGKTCFPPMTIPDVGRFAGLQDPQGAVLSIIQLTHHKP